MATLTEYFDTEARHFLVELERAVNRGPLPDAGELHRAARALRGTAQMAREDGVQRAATALEAVARSLAANTVSWSDDVRQRVRDHITDLRVLVERTAGRDDLDARLAAAVDRWSDLGITLPAGLTGAAEPARDPADGASEFREFAAREVAAVADELDRGVQQLAAEPMDREPLKLILRRQRALLGSARLDEIPVVAEILRAVEDLTRVIAKLDVGVKQEWLDIYRVAREGLKAAVEPLQRNENPEPSHPLSRLRHMREELLERYGVGEAVSAAHESAGLVQAVPVHEPPDPVSLPAKAADDADDTAAAVAVADDAAADADADYDADAADATDTATAADDDATAATADEAAVSAVGGASGSDDSGDTPDLLAAASGAMQRAASAGDVAADATVAIEDLCYSGDAALARAEELRPAVERAAAHDAAARDAVDELFDLIRIARG